MENKLRTDGVYVQFITKPTKRCPDTSSREPHFIQTYNIIRAFNNGKVVTIGDFWKPFCSNCNFEPESSQKSGFKSWEESNEKTRKTIDKIINSSYVVEHEIQEEGMLLKFKIDLYKYFDVDTFSDPLEVAKQVYKKDFESLSSIFEPWSIVNDSYERSLKKSKYNYICHLTSKWSNNGSDIVYVDDKDIIYNLWECLPFYNGHGVFNILSIDEYKDRECIYTVPFVFCPLETTDKPEFFNNEYNAFIDKVNCDSHQKISSL